MKHTHYKTISFVLFLLIFFPALTHGAEFIATSTAQAIHAGDQFEVNILLNTDGENANAFGGMVTYPTDLLQLKEIRDGNTIVNFWVDMPTSTPSGVLFSGITPGGYQGQSGKIMSLIFTAKVVGQGNIGIVNTQLLRNDGAGSEIPLTVSNFSFSIAAANGQGGVVVPEIKNTELPEAFVPQVGQDPSVFDGKWFIAFAAEDKGSGIDHYEVKESKYTILDFSKWNIATSPYLLTDQNLESTIYVKAVDKSGNERIEMISPKHPIAFYANLDNWFILVLIITFLWLYKNLVWKKYK